MNRRNSVAMMIAGAMASVGGGSILNNAQQPMYKKVLSYKKGGKPFTRGKRSKSLRTRANRRKAKC